MQQNNDTPHHPSRVVMLHMGRCGSTVLADMLAQRGDFCWDGEIFNGPGKRNAKLLDRFVGKNNRWSRSIFFPYAPYAYIKSRMWRRKASVYGFEVKLFNLRTNDLQEETFFSEVRKMQFTHLILLFRKNYLRKTISALSAMQEGKWHYSLNEKPEPSQVELDPNSVFIDDQRLSLIEHFQRLDQECGRLDELTKDYKVLRLTYEEDVMNDPHVGYTKICHFLGREPIAVSVRLNRTNPFAVHQLLAQSADVESAVAGTKYEWMLHSSDGSASTFADNPSRDFF